MRTEFLFLERHSAPDEEEQYQVYREMVEAMAGRRLIIRTLDIGGDKQAPYLDLPREENPFLGVRGARATGRANGWVGVCGGLAGDPLRARILTGLGVDELSMSAQDIAPVKAALRGEARAAMQELAQRALRARTAEEVRAL